jgi:hypothetical protein
MSLSKVKAYSRGRRRAAFWRPWTVISCGLSAGKTRRLIEEDSLRAARRPPRSQPPAPRQKASAAPGGRLWIAGVTRLRALTHKARRSNLNLAFLNFPAQETRSEARNPRSHRPGVSIRFWPPSRHRSPQTPANPRRHPKSTASCREYSLTLNLTAAVPIEGPAQVMDGLSRRTADRDRAPQSRT